MNNVIAKHGTIEGGFTNVLDEKWFEDKKFKSMESSLGHTDQAPLLLASASPRRRELLSLTGWSNEVRATKINEIFNIGESPESYVKRVAQEKARKALESVDDSYIVLAADTIVVKEDRIFGKPENPDHAKQILSELAGKSHRVLTALAIAGQDPEPMLVDVCETAVPMRMYSPKEVDEYVASGSPLDKAGAYGIQDDDFHPVELEKMEGCYANVMGLPLCHLTRSMKGFGLMPVHDVPIECQRFINFRCKAFPKILGYQS